MFAVTDFPDLPNAKCKHDDPETKTPELSDSAPLAELQQREAVAGCAGCVELVRCMAWADSEREPYGAWGGRWWDGAPTDVAVDGAPVPQTRIRSVPRERVA